MKLSLISAATLAIATCTATAAIADPVVVELFTSEGCSSCPPADALLRDLGERDDVIILAWHVDYWDRLGWKDPFGDAAYTERQRRYAKSMNLSSLYTPQMIINGAAEFVGSDRSRATRELKRANALPAPVSIDALSMSNEAATIRVTVEDAPADARLLIAITEDNLESADIPRGENEGKTLLHDGVVRYHATLDLHAEEKQMHTVKLPVDASWSKQNLKVIALVEPSDGHGILGATVKAANAAGR